MRNGNVVSQISLHARLQALAVALAVCAGSFAAAEEATEKAAAATARAPQTVREFIDAALGEYEVFPNAASEQPAQVLTVLRWANNARGSEDGVTVLYVHGGRPLAAACVYPWAARLEHDFESLSRGKIVARHDGVPVWQPQTAGVTFADLPDAPAPEATRLQRLRQMKALAGRFQATLLGWRADDSDREELRLLSRPLYRYEPNGGPRDAASDGAVFAFVMGTDPEVLLLIEAVDQGESAKWQYAFARRTSGELEGRLGGAAVWKAAKFPVQDDPQRTHYTRGTPLPAALLAPPTAQEKTIP